MAIERQLELNGVSKTVKEWEKTTRINRSTILARIARGMTVEEALTKPPKKIAIYKRIGDREYKVKKSSIEKRMTDAEREAFIKAITPENFGKLARRNLGICLFLLNTGCRLGESCLLRVYDVLDHSKKIKEYLDIRAEIAKRKKNRQIPLNLKAKEALSLLIDVEKCSMEDPIIKLSPRQTREMINQVSVYAGLNRLLTPHCLRHDFLSRVYYQTKDVKITQRLAGHSSSSTTMDCYVDSTWDDLENAVNKIN